MALLRWIKGYGTPVAGAASAVLIGLSTHPDFAAQEWMVPAGITLAILSIVGIFTVHPSYPKLVEQRNGARAEAEAIRASMRGTLKAILKRLMSDIELTNTHLRVSIYCHSDASFLMLARHSGHARHAQTGRVRYREAEDVITAAWAEGWSVFIDLPASKSKRVDELVRRQGMTIEDAQNLSMPSRSVVGYRLVHDGDPVGVLVLESTQPRGVGHDTKDLLDACDTVTLCGAIMASAPDRLEGMVTLPRTERWWRRTLDGLAQRSRRRQAKKLTQAQTPA